MGLMADKQAWRAHMAAVHALPRDYEVVYLEIQKYVFKVGPVAASGQEKVLAELLQLFQDGAERQADVLDVTGHDVAAFADELIAGVGGVTLMDKYLAE
jgi:DNA-binding ferritin-like protein (Dps family)